MTIAPLINLWGFGKTVVTEDRIPLQQDIDVAKANSGSNKINVIINHSAATARLSKTQVNIEMDLSRLPKVVVLICWQNVLRSKVTSITWLKWW